MRIMPGIAARVDYDREAKNTERMRLNFAADDSVVIRVFTKYSTRRVLTEESSMG